MNFVQVITSPPLVTLTLSLVQVMKVHPPLIMNASTSTMRKMPLPGQTRDLGVRASNSAIASHGRCVILDRKCYLIYIVTEAKYGRRQNTDGADVFFTLNS